MKNVTIKAYCKINISLDIKGLREDGKHGVDMVMQTLPLHDVIEMKKIPSDNKEIVLKSNAEWVPTNSKNTAYKAAELLVKNFAKIDSGTEIFIDKKVPGCGGLGGSSADAAGVLLGMNKLFDLGLSVEELQEYGAQIGADVPFLIRYGAAIATGTGTTLEYVEPLKEGILLLVNSGAEVSTAEAYKTYDELEKNGKIPSEAHQSARETANAMKIGLDALVGKTKNVLEYPAFCLQPEIENIKKEIEETGAAVSMMSGSGATVFGIFRKKDQEKALAAQKVFESRGWFTYICDFENFE
ncbi:MAG: 4-(cytidine 5'-diphospho)-2-C-methyl-D-erythritol kinase [Ruminococcaceae bacterium]|nr:4-(cytidine 5'-diphospho)-2-C-methyl-D-erythritol kinase [Oscillospiraceae bacterium]